MVLNVGIIGCGVIGTRRAKIIQNSVDSKVIAVCDNALEKAKSLGKQLDCDYYDNWNKILSRSDVNAVVISTTNNYLAMISLNAALNKKHIFCEKPLGTNIKDVESAVKEANKQQVIFKTGFTLRFHPGIQKAKSVISEGQIGKILFIRCRYGITGRPGYDKEWRAQKEISGGGELIDQGIHVIDLCRWFLGDFSSVIGKVGTLFWNTTVDDNAFGILTTSSNQMASFHVSWTQWNNIFSLEVFGDNGYVIVEGLGGAYGKETVKIGKKPHPDKWPPEEIQFVFNKPETCWEEEWKDFVSSINNNTIPSGSGLDGLEALKIVFKIYESSNVSMPIS